MSSVPKKCKGCGSSVANPVTCVGCGIVSHKGVTCLGRTGHPWSNGRLLNCATRSTTPSCPSDVSLSLIPSPPMLSQASFPSVGEMRNLIGEVVREELNKFRYEMIAGIRSELAEVRSAVGDLSARVCQLEANASSPSDVLPSGPLVTEVVVAEISERHLRARNVIVHGLTESCNTSPAQAKKEDIEGVKCILNQIQPSEYDDLRLRRLGKQKGPSPRPLCVTLESSEVAKCLLRNKSRYPGPCKITDDKTIVQRQALEQLRAKLRELQENGETNKTIRYIHGVPKIVNCSTSRDSAPKNH